MTQGQLKIQIDKKITDEMMMEYCLNLYFSGYDPFLLMGFYSLGKGWHFNKIVQLTNLMEDKKER